MSKLPKPLTRLPAAASKAPSDGQRQPDSGSATGSDQRKVFATLRAPLSRRSKTVSEFQRRPLTALQRNDFPKPLPPKERPTAPKRAAPSATEIRPKIAKPNPPPVKPVPSQKKITGKPAPYDYKARFNLLHEKHQKLLAERLELREKLVSATNEAEDSLAASEKFGAKLAEATADLKLLRNKNSVDEATIERLAAESNEYKELYEDRDSRLIKCAEESAALTVENDSLRERLAASESTARTLSDDLHHYKKSYEALRAQVQRHDVERRDLHNQIQDLKGNIRVFCRVRPHLETERQRLLSDFKFPDEGSIELSKPRDSVEPSGRNRASRHEFAFDKVFTPESSQGDVFFELAQLVQSVLDGYNVCVFAYGQTGSGKTYTMEGCHDMNSIGMIPRAIDLIFESFEARKQIGWTYTIKTSFLEIYNEHIVDLLDSRKNQHHEIRMTDQKGTDVYVTNLTIETPESADDLKRLMKIAQRNRAVAATENNERSSRSHSVTKILLEGFNEERDERHCGALNLVDLAGSERVHNTDTTRLAETKNINRSLANLGNVILALHQKSDHVPYRNSKLTHLLQPSLGGNSKTLMLVNISPLEDCFNESVNSLRFAAKVNQCKTGAAKKNKSLS